MYISTDTTPQVIVYDPGFGNGKTATPAGVTSIQTAVSHPKDAGRAGVGLASAKVPHRIIVDNIEFFVGPGAASFGTPLTTMDFSDIASPSRRAVFYANLHDLGFPQMCVSPLLLLALPVPLMSSTKEFKALMPRLARAYKGDHCFSVNGKEYVLSINKMSALAQPVGAFFNWAINDDGQFRQDWKKKEVAILDLGMNTLDMFVIQAGKVVPRFIGGAKVGMRRLLESMNGHGHDIQELDGMFRSKRLKPSKEQLTTWMASVMGAVEQEWPNLRRFDAVIPTGGGAMVLGEMLFADLAAKGAAIHWPDDPITANAAGLYKYGALKV